jgi:hypothetical protein
MTVSHVLIHFVEKILCLFTDETVEPVSTGVLVDCFCSCQSGLSLVR